MKECKYYKGEKDKYHPKSCLGCEHIEYDTYEPPLCGHKRMNLHEVAYPYMEFFKDRGEYGEYEVLNE
jgi:hypothetical protein